MLEQQPFPNPKHARSTITPVRMISRLPISYHTQGRVIYWKYQEYEPENSYAIAQKMATIKWLLLGGPDLPIPMRGIAIGLSRTYNKPGYTIEAGLGTNPSADLAI